MRRWCQIGAVILLALALGGREARADNAAGDSEGSAVRVASTAKPRAVSAAERAAVEMAAGFLQQGPEALWPRLAPASPLRKLGHASALREIAARVGPADGATWQLLTPGPGFDQRTAVFGVEFASGLDETLVFHLVSQGGWKLSDIRTSVDPVEIKAPSESAASMMFQSRRRKRIAVAAAILLFFVGVGAASQLERARKRSAAVAAALTAFALGAGVLFWQLLPGAPRLIKRDKPDKPPAVVRLGELAPLRAALAAGSDRAEIERRLAASPRDPALRDVQDLWRAQYLLGEAKLPAVDGILDRFPSPTEYPLAELLRARLAFVRLQPKEAAKSYDRLIDSSLDDDGLRLESAVVKTLSNEMGLAQVEFTLMAEMGSRLAESWYAAAEVSAADDQMEDAESLLRQAWQLQPVPRSELFGNPLLSVVVARPKVFPLFAFGKTEEARVPPKGTPRPLLLPDTASAATCGQSLRLVFGTAELLVPGGAELAPASSVVEDADVWSRHVEEKALAALPTLTAGGAQESFQPRRLRLAELAGRALAEQNRWSDLLALTEPVAAHVEKAPAILVRLRAQALHQLERDEEARRLLIRLAKTDIASRRPAPGTLFELAELFAATGQYDTAIKLSRKADSQLPEPRGERRRRQLALERDLAASYASYRSEHFDVRYPRATGELYARGVSQVLEAEHRRLQQWIPEAGKKPIEVHLFSVQEFMSSFGGGGVVGIFDGKVRVPLADLWSLDPVLVAILSHELAHAMIAARTRDQAPHWLQEGLAQHIEMGVGRLNPMPDLARTGRALSFPTIDLILRGFAEPQLVDLAYGEAAWTVNFIESRWGVKGIHRLLAAFAAGKTTEQALREVCGLSQAEFDRALWAWGTSRAPKSRNLEVRLYEKEYISQVMHERGRKEDDTAPQIGLREEIRSKMVLDEQQAEERRRAMAAWHRVYAPRTEGVRQAFREILQVYTGKSTANPARSCNALSIAVSHSLADPQLWSSPDPKVNRALRDTYELLAKLASACAGGRDAEARVLFRQSGEALANATRLLAPYGLEP